MSIGEEPICFTCKNMRVQKGNWHCLAFPNGIPEKILTMEHDHHFPYKGDNGIQYEELSTGEELQYVD